MPIASVTVNANIGGISAGGTLQRSATGQISHEVSVAAGLSGELDGMDSAGTAGTVDNLDSGHAVAEGDIVNVFAAAAESDGTRKVRHSIPVDSADATSFTFDDVSAGDAGGAALPTADDTAVVVSEFGTEIDSDFDGDDVLAFVVSADQPCVVQFQEGDGTVVGTIVLAKASEPFVWIKDQGIANPLAGNAVGKIKVANGGTSAATVKIGILYDSDE